MPEVELHRWLTWAEIGLAALTFTALFFVTAPYGRATRRGWGPMIPARLGWIVMESPPVIVWLGIYLLGDHRFEALPLLFAGLWQLHYVHRAFVFPLRMRMTGKQIVVPPDPELN